MKSKTGLLGIFGVLAFIASLILAVYFLTGGGK